MSMFLWVAVLTFNEQIMEIIRYTRRLILKPISAARSWIGLCRPTADYRIKTHALLTLGYLFVCSLMISYMIYDMQLHFFPIQMRVMLGGSRSVAIATILQILQEWPSLKLKLNAKVWVPILLAYIAKRRTTLLEVRSESNNNSKYQMKLSIKDPFGSLWYLK